MATYVNLITSTMQPIQPVSSSDMKNNFLQIKSALVDGTLDLNTKSVTINGTNTTVLSNEVTGGGLRLKTDSACTGGFELQTYNAGPGYTNKLTLSNDGDLNILSSAAVSAFSVTNATRAVSTGTLSLTGPSVDSLGGNIFSGSSSGALSITAGATNQGGRIELYGGTHATLPGQILIKTGTTGGATTAITIANTGVVTFAQPIVATITTAAQTNITSVGTLVSLTVSGAVTAGTSSTGVMWKVLNIGDWDMVASDNCAVAHGLGDSFKKIVSVFAVIRTDNDAAYYNLSSYIGGVAMGGVYSFSNTNINLARETGGIFNHTDFNATSFNRGFVYVAYTA